MSNIKKPNNKQNNQLNIQMPSHLNRRQFLSTGGAILLLPSLVSLMSVDEAKAQSAPTETVKRAIFTPTLYGVDPAYLYPDLTNLTTLSGAIHTSYTSLSSLPLGRISKMIGPEFNSIRSKMNIIEGLGIATDNFYGHNFGVLAGVGNDRAPTIGTTMDVLLEESTVFNPNKKAAIRVTTNHLGIDFSFKNKNGVRTTYPYRYGDYYLFNSMFGNFTANPAAVDRTNINKKTLIDLVLRDINSLKNHKRISSSDVQLINEYSNRVHEVQQRIIANTATAAPACAKPNIALQHTNPLGEGYHFMSSANIKSVEKMYENIFETIAISFVCDLTRVVVIGNEQIEDTPRGTGDVQNRLHHSGNMDQQMKDQAWFLTQVSKLATRLNSQNDPMSASGTLLDNSVIFYTNEHGNDGHHNVNMPAITFGGAGGQMKTGYYMDYRQKPIWNNNGNSDDIGRPYKQLLITMMDALGLPRAAYMSEGDGNGFGEFKRFVHHGIDTYAPYANEHNNKLPFL